MSPCRDNSCPSQHFAACPAAPHLPWLGLQDEQAGNQGCCKLCQHSPCTAGLEQRKELQEPGMRSPSGFWDKKTPDGSQGREKKAGMCIPG